MASNNLPKTWTQFIDLLDKDKIVRDTLREAAKAKEVGPRAPALLYIRALKDAGNEYFEVLPEPWSDQDKKRHGDGTDVDLDTVAKWNGNPKRYWDNYSYEVQGQKVSGSVFLDMVDRTEDGKAYVEFARLCADWNKDGDKTNLQSIAVFNGVQYDLENMPPNKRSDLKAMADSRRYTARDNLRIMVQIWRNVRDIEKLFKGIAEVDFIFEPEPDEDGNQILEKVKKPIEVWAIQTIKDHPRFGQRTGNYFSCTSSQFANLAPRKCAAIENGKTMENLKRIKRKAAKSGAQPSSSEIPKQQLSGIIVSSNNFGFALEKMAAFCEDESSRASWTNQLVHLSDATERELQIAAAVQVYNMLGSCITADWLQVHKRVYATQADKKASDLAAKLKSEAATKEAETQPTQHQRNAAEAASSGNAERQFITTADADEANGHKDGAGAVKPQSGMTGRTPASSFGGRKKAAK